MTRFSEWCYRIPDSGSGQLGGLVGSWTDRRAGSHDVTSYMTAREPLCARSAISGPPRGPPGRLDTGPQVWLGGADREWARSVGLPNRDGAPHRFEDLGHVAQTQPDPRRFRRIVLVRGPRDRPDLRRFATGPAAVAVRQDRTNSRGRPAAPASQPRLPNSLCYAAERIVTSRLSRTPPLRCTSRAKAIHSGRFPYRSPPP